jgi:hypothetical protein
LVSPPLAVPPADQNPRLRFWHWWSFGASDFGRVEIRVGNGPWEELSEQFSGGSGGWTSSRELNLARYAEQIVQVGFYFESHVNCDPWHCWATVGPGWYIDDLLIKVGNLTIAGAPDQTVDEVNTVALPNSLSYQVQTVGSGPGSCLSFSLPWAPKGAWIDPESGLIGWSPSECQGPGVYNIPVYVVDYCHNEANDLGFVKVTVNEVNEAPWLLAASETVAPGQTLEFTPCTGDPDCPRNPLKYELYQLSEAIPAGATIDPDTGTFKWTPTVAQFRPAKPYVMGVRLCDNGSPNKCVTSTMTVTVTDHTPITVGIQSAGAGKLEFTIVGGRTDSSYMLQRTAALNECPFATPWEDVLKVTPTSVPFTFEYAPPDWAQPPLRFYRFREALP